MLQADNQALVSGGGEKSSSRVPCNVLSCFCLAEETILFWIAYMKKPLSESTNGRVTATLIVVFMLLARCMFDHKDASGASQTAASPITMAEVARESRANKLEIKRATGCHMLYPNQLKKVVERIGAPSGVFENVRTLLVMVSRIDAKIRLRINKRTPYERSSTTSAMMTKPYMEVVDESSSLTFMPKKPAANDDGI